MISSSIQTKEKPFFPFGWALSRLGAIGTRAADGGYIHSKGETVMIRKLKSGEYRLYSRKLDPKTHKRKNLGTFKSREAAEKHEREVQYFKHH
ncbi:hypothetical protein A9Z06_00430 [Rhizobium sp. YK2]|nr:hypothetical protein A9Z06_00430 [Rhizobium sp. YK2]